MKYNPEIHHRRSIRLKGYDYTQPGAYFVTICSHQRDEIFGEIINGEMKLSALGETVHEEWLRSAKIRKEIQIFEDEFVIMPNHVHAIVRIIETVGAGGRAASPNGGVRPNTERAHAMRPNAFPRRAPRSLGSFIAGFKASVTSRATRELNITGIWQRNYHERIIRDETEFKNIWNYIDTNPLHWQKDQLHPSASRTEYNQK